MALKHENGKWEGTISLRKIFKSIKRFFKNLWKNIIYFFNPNSPKLSKKFKKKKEERRKKKSEGWSIIDRILLKLSGADNLKAVA